MEKVTLYNFSELENSVKYFALTNNDIFNYEISHFAELLEQDIYDELSYFIDEFNSDKNKKRRELVYGFENDYFLIASGGYKVEYSDIEIYPNSIYITHKIDFNGDKLYKVLCHLARKRGTLINDITKAKIKYFCDNRYIYLDVGRRLSWGEGYYIYSDSIARLIEPLMDVLLEKIQNLIDSIQTSIKYYYDLDLCIDLFDVDTKGRYYSNENNLVARQIRFLLEECIDASGALFTKTGKFIGFQDDLI